jgi:membrane protein
MIKFLKSLYKRYSEDNVADRAAALSYYTIFSLGPLLFVIFGVLGELLKSSSYKARLISQMKDLVGPQAGSLINNVLSHETLSSKAGVAFLVGTVGLVLGAIGIFGQLQKSLDSILHIKVGPGAGWKSIIKQKAIALGLVGVVCFLLLVSLVASAIIASITHHYNSAAAGFLFNLADFLVSVFVFAILLTLIYRNLPEVKLPWGILFKTSLIVAIFFSVGKSILGLIIGNNSNISAFGAAGSLIALLLWIFYSGQVIFLGVAGIAVYADTHIVPFTPRYPGKKGVLRVEMVEKPLTNSLLELTKRKFKEGFKKGLKQEK